MQLRPLSGRSPLAASASFPPKTGWFSLYRQRLADGGLGALALLVVWWQPPFWGWQPVGGPVFVLTPVALVGLAVARVRWLATGLLWLIIAACLFTPPPDKLGVPQQSVYAPRLLVLATLLTVWWLLMPLAAWLKRAGLALLVPTIVVALFWGLAGSPISPDFEPYQLTSDTAGHLLVSDYDAPIIRVFSAQGDLLGKLRTDDNLFAGTSGFIGAGPSDPAQLGLNPSYNSIPPDFKTCGLAADTQGHFYVLADRARQLAQLDSSTGRLTALWNLPAEYQATPGCLAYYAGHLYLADGSATPSIDVFNLTNGRVVDRWLLPASSTALAADGAGRLYALTRDRQVCYFALATAARTCLPLPDPPDGASNPYEGLTATPQRFFVGDVTTSQILVFDQSGQLTDRLAGPGSSPGRLQVPRALATDTNGDLLINDFGHRVIQRFHLSGRRWQVNGLWRALQDENEADE